SNPTDTGTLHRKPTEFSQEGPLLFRRNPVPIHALQANQRLGHGQKLVKIRYASVDTIAKQVHVENFLRRKPLISIVAQDAVLRANQAVEGIDGTVYNAPL